MPDISPRKRHKSRWLILQCLYQLQLNDKDPKEVEAESEESHIYRLADKEYFHSVFQGIIQHKDELDATLAEINKFKDTKLDPIMLAVLQIGLYELQYRKDIDHPVIIKEAIVLCKEFMHADSHIFANRILDLAAKKIRLGIDISAESSPDATTGDPAGSKDSAEETVEDAAGDPADNKVPEEATAGDTAGAVADNSPDDTADDTDTTDDTAGDTADDIEDNKDPAEETAPEDPKENSTDNKIDDTTS